MGLLDSVVGALGGQEQNSVVTQVMALINNPNGGGLAGLLQQFKAGGLGHVADSWVGTGQNLPISAEQLQCVLGSEQVQQMAAKVGISPDMLSGQLAKLLPQAVDKVTPDGNIPDQGAIAAEVRGIVGNAGRTLTPDLHARARCSAVRLSTGGSIARCWAHAICRNAGVRRHAIAP
jgi:uncharacterized protein YidB (DUF937 family)